MEVMKKMMRHHKTLSFFYFSSSSSSAAPFTLHLLLVFCLICSVTLIPTSSFASSNETDRLALLEFKHRISSDDPNGVEVLNSWNASVHHCGWQGVTCGHRHRRVVGLELPEMGLVGTISPRIGNLTFLRLLGLSGNNLYGQIQERLVVCFD
nr:probable LRR receptor-like serine/threonine-protein kinase At3g47570 [Ipomoea batatas]